MVGPAEIGAAIGGLKGMLDIAKGLKSMADEASINELKIALQSAVLEAQGGLLAAQEVQATNLQRIAELEQQIASLEDWSAERNRYQLSAIGVAGFAYIPKAEMENGEPMHWLCQPCFETRHKSVLQFTEVTATAGGRGMKSSWSCSHCGCVVKAGMSARPADPSTW